MSLQFHYPGTPDRRKELFRLLGLFNALTSNTDWTASEAEVTTALASVMARVNAVEAEIEDLRREMLDLDMKIAGVP